MRFPIAALPVVFLACLSTTAIPAEDWDLNKMPASRRGKKLRADGKKLWDKARPVCDKVFAKEEVDPAHVTQAMEDLELAAVRLERALSYEWHTAANKMLCDVITAWFKTLPLVPKPPEPKDDKERKRAVSKAKKERSSHLTAARKRLMEYGSSRRFAKLYRRCGHCEGRKELRNPLDRTSRPCTVCRRTGRLSVRMGIVHSRWSFHSPFYRADRRRMLEVNRSLRLSTFDTKRLQPFVKSVAIRGKPEYHGTWVRIKAREKIHSDPAGKKIESVDITYTLYRIGRVWYLYHQRYDSGLVDIPPVPEPIETTD